jgi:hypothetical protein
MFRGFYKVSAKWQNFLFILAEFFLAGIAGRKALKTIWQQCLFGALFPLG